mgnify:CR=1 FL=1
MPWIHINSYINIIQEKNGGDAYEDEQKKSDN